MWSIWHKQIYILSKQDTIQQAVADAYVVLRVLKSLQGNLHMSDGALRVDLVREGRWPGGV